MTDDITYLDYAAATPLDEAVLSVMMPYFTETFFNPSATYGPSRAVADDLLAARSKIAHWLGVRPSEIIFTAGGTESDNLAIHGIMRRFPQGNVIVSAIEHEAVLQPAGQYDCRVCPVDTTGIVQLDTLRASIDDATVLVSIMYANNEIGTIQPLAEIGRLVTEIRTDRKLRGITTPLFFHSDACQAANFLDVHVSRYGLDMMTLNGGKIYGPKQSGILYVRGGVELEPLIYGGGQEHGLRNGTENVAACIGFSHALDIAQTIRKDEVHRLSSLKSTFKSLLSQQIPAIQFNGSDKKSLPNTVHVTIPGQDNERLLVKLETRGVLAAAGSACSAASDEPSHVLRAIGVSDAEARSSLRFSMGKHTNLQDIERAARTLADSMEP